MKVEKAIEISDAKIAFISLVDKAANKRQFLITKADDGNAQFATLGKILKVDDTTHYITGIVYEPLVEDSHGNFMTEEEIRKAAYWFAKNGDQVDIQHSFEAAAGISVVETYIAPCDMTVGETAVLKGTWIMTAEVENAEVWEKVQKGEVTGFSMGGVGKYSEKDVELADASEKKGIFKKMAALFGFDVVEKGEVKDKFNKQVKAGNFWRAWDALADVLHSYNWETGAEWFESDETKIRGALSEFSEIVTTLLTKDEVMKSLSAHKPVEKTGKKISGKNLTELQKIHENVGALIGALSDEEKEENDVTKQEIQTMIDEAVKKAATPAAAAMEEPAQLTAEVVQAMIDGAIQKALNPPDAPLTAESVEAMVTKALEPILKARGLPSNLSGEKEIEKSSEQHYLAGVI